MTLPDPTCHVNGTVTPIDVSASSTITIALASPAGAIFWSIQCTSTDELDNPAAVNATLVVNQTNKTATCTLSAVLGAAYIFTSTVGILGLGLDANGSLQKAFTTTFKVNVQAANTARVLAENETFEQNAAAGWTAVINPALRQGVNVPTTVGGTGFVRVISGVIQPNGSPVNLSSNGAGGDVTGLLPWVNGGRLQGALHVTNATSPGLLSPIIQIAYMRSSTGATAATMPGAPTPDLLVQVLDTEGAASTNAIVVHPNGNSAENPNVPGTFTTADIVLGQSGIAVTWQWDADRVHWKVVSSFGIAVGVGAPVVVAGTHTLQPGETWAEVHPGDAVTFPVVPIVGDDLLFVGVGSGFSSNPVTFLGNGKNVENPEDPNNVSGNLPAGPSVTGTSENFRWIFRYNGTLYRCVSSPRQGF